MRVLSDARSCGATFFPMRMLRAKLRRRRGAAPSRETSGARMGFLGRRQVLGKYPVLRLLAKTLIEDHLVRMAGQWLAGRHGVLQIGG